MWANGFSVPQRCAQGNGAGPHRAAVFVGPTYRPGSEISPVYSSPFLAWALLGVRPLWTASLFRHVSNLPSCHEQDRQGEPEPGLNQQGRWQSTQNGQGNNDRSSPQQLCCGDSNGCYLVQEVHVRAVLVASTLMPQLSDAGSKSLDVNDD